ncbi:MAG: 4Fe-4S binding protein [Acidimicrobiales bacterium]
MKHDQKRPKSPRLRSPRPQPLRGQHGEKCIGCELCAGVCPAKCIYVRQGRV